MGETIIYCLVEMRAEQIAVLKKSQWIYKQSIKFAFHFYQWNTRNAMEHADCQ